MRFKEFYNNCTFTLLDRGASNWDYYLMQYKDGPGNVVAIAKKGSGAADCHFGDLKYYSRKKLGVI